MKQMRVAGGARPLVRALVGGLLAAGVVACGGGGGGDPGSNSRAYVVGGTVWGVPGSGLVLQINGGNGLAIDGLTFEFPQPISDGTPYQVTVVAQPGDSSCTVANGSGVVRGAAVTDVSVICRAWRTAQTIGWAGELDTMDAAADADGHVISLWSHGGGSQNDLWTRRYMVGSGWGVAEAMTSAGADSFFYPRAAVDGAGNALAVWRQFDGTSTSIYARRYAAGVGWGVATPIDATSTGQLFDADVAVDERGNGMAMWVRLDQGEAQIYASRFTAGVWGAPERVGEPSSFFAETPQVAFDDAGNAVAVWHIHTLGRFHVFTSRYAPASGWSAATRIENEATGYSKYARIAVDGAGNAVVVWQQHDDTRFNVWASRYDVATGWSAPNAIEVMDEGDATGLHLSADRKGNVIAVWQQSDGFREDVWAARYAVGSGWSAAERLEGDAAGDALSPQVGVDADGNGMAVWTQSDGVTFQTYASRYVVDTGWGLPQAVGRGSEVATMPQVVVAPGGEAFAIWRQISGATGSVRAARFE